MAPRRMMRSGVVLVLVWTSAITAATRAAAGGALELLLRDEVVVTSSEVRLADVARVAGTAGGELPADLAALAIARIEGGGGPLRIDAACVRNRILRAGRGAEASVAGGGPCLVARRGTALDATRVRAEVMRAARGWSEGLGDSIGLEVGDPPAGWIPGGASSLVIVVPEGPASPGAATFLADVYAGDARVARLAVRVTVTVFRMAPVAARRLERHRAIGAGDVRWQRIAVRSRGGSMPADASSLAGCRTTRIVPEGEVLTGGMLEARPTVRRGEDVTVEMSSGCLRVTLVARALDDGVPGEVIRVRNPFTRETLRARVTGPGTLEFVAGGR